MADAGMEFETYQRAAARTIKPGMAREELLLMAAIGLCGEAGEAAEHIKKAVFHGKPLDLDALVLELGDVLWYLALYASALNAPLAGIAEENIAKLRARWPGKFGDVVSTPPAPAPEPSIPNAMKCFHCPALATWVRDTDDVRIFRCVQGHITREPLPMTPGAMVPTADCACDGVGMCSEHVAEMLQAHPMDEHTHAVPADVQAAMLLETAPCEACDETSAWMQFNGQLVFRCGNGHVSRVASAP